MVMFQHLLYLSFLRKNKGNVKTLRLIVSGCLRVIPTSLDFIWRKYNLLSHLKFNSFHDFMIGTIAMFSLDTILYKGMGLAFNQENQALEKVEFPISFKIQQFTGFLDW